MQSRMLLILAHIAGVFISVTPCTAPTLIVVVVHTRSGFQYGLINAEVAFRRGCDHDTGRIAPLRGRWTIPSPVPLRLDWRRAMLAALVASSFFAHSSVYADEFDVLTVYSEARPLNDEWQVCVASFARRRLRSAETPERLAKEAFD